MQYKPCIGRHSYSHCCGSYLFALLTKNVAIFDKLFGSNAMEEEDRVLAHAIVATTLRFSQDPRLTPQSRRRYHDVSKQRVQLYALNNPTVRALQSLVILALDVLGTSNGPQGASLLALIAQNIVHLGLGREKGVFLETPACPSIGTVQAFVLPQPKSWIEDEERRRLFWMTYVLDRYATIDTAFDFALNEREMDRALPCRYDQFSENVPVETKWFRWTERSETIINCPENCGSFSFHCEVLRILSRVHRFLKRPVDIASAAEVQQWRETYRGLGAELDSWLHNLPGDYGKISQLCHSDPASKIANWIMLHAAFVTATIRLHSSAAYPTIRSHMFTPSFNATQKCLSAVESLREIAQDVVNTRGLNLLGPPFAFSLWVSARLLLVHAATMECEVDPKIHFFISTLEQMGQFWEVAQNYANILIHVVREHQQSESPPEGADPAMTAIMTFTAMRRCAYDLNLLISQRPRTVLNPISRTPTLKELEYLEVFDFFNYPRLSNTVVGHSPVATTSMPNVEMEHTNGFRPASFAMPTPESDWLIFKPPYD